MKFSEAFKNLAIAAMTAIALYVATKIEDMTTSIAQLNTNVALLIQKVDGAQATLGDHEARIRALERK